MRQDSFLLTLLGGSLALNVYLGLHPQTRPVPSSNPTALTVGARLPKLTGKTLDGRPFEASAADGRDLAVYVFSTTCSWCEKNLDNIRTLASRTWKTHRIVGVSTGPEAGLQNYCRENGINFEVISDVSEQLQKAWSMDGTPQLLIVSRDGRLKKSFMGALDKKNLEDAAAFFSARLPGLTEAPRQPATPRVVQGQCLDSWGGAFDRGSTWPVFGVLQRCTEKGWTRVVA